MHLGRIFRGLNSALGVGSKIVVLVAQPHLIPSAVSPENCPLPVDTLSTETALPFQAALRGHRGFSLWAEAASSGSHSLVLTLGLGTEPANLNPCYQCILHVCETSSYILSESSCFQMKLLLCFDFSSCDRMSWPTVTCHHMSSAQVPLTGGIPRWGLTHALYQDHSSPGLC